MAGGCAFSPKATGSCSLHPVNETFIKMVHFYDSPATNLYLEEASLMHFYVRMDPQSIQ
jgi:hypothetical protein